MSISRRAAQFQDLLHARGLDIEVVELPASTRSADDAARAIGCDKAQIVKSLVFRDTVTGEPVLVLASGPNRVDERAIARHIGHDVAKADADLVREATGYAIGGVPPLGHRRELAVFVDEDLLALPETWAAAGTPNAVFRIEGKITDLLGPHTVVALHQP